MPRRRRSEALRASGAAVLGGALGLAAVEVSGYAAYVALAAGATAAGPVGGAVGAFAGLALYGLVRLVED